MPAFTLTIPPRAFQSAPSSPSLAAVSMGPAPSAVAPQAHSVAPGDVTSATALSAMAAASRAAGRRKTTTEYRALLLGGGGQSVAPSAPSAYGRQRVTRAPASVAAVSAASAYLPATSTPPSDSPPKSLPVSTSVPHPPRSRAARASSAASALSSPSLAPACAASNATHAQDAMASRRANTLASTRARDASSAPSLRAVMRMCTAQHAYSKRPSACQSAPPLPPLLRLVGAAATTVPLAASMSANTHGASVHSNASALTLIAHAMSAASAAERPRNAPPWTVSRACWHIMAALSSASASTPSFAAPHAPIASVRTLANAPPRARSAACSRSACAAALADAGRLLLVSPASTPPCSSAPPSMARAPPQRMRATAQRHVASACGFMRGAHARIASSSAPAVALATPAPSPPSPANTVVQSHAREAVAHAVMLSSCGM
mmetsp:Transcript_11616/g.48842  ORF Transcript_11616/g.48842 Transcript_11616/m.48842 type:complete len:435 (-) Transcript_11616:984-2288(-)